MNSLGERKTTLAKQDGGISVNGHAVSSKQIDAGMRHLDHYAARLPKWRHHVRQSLIPIIRAETPFLALLQAKLRRPFLDSYFAFTANLGTHTFFMVMLPVLFWCGHTDFGRAMVHLLALGVILSGVVKDLLCLPRPLSPPLQRITMSGSAALEYGFPSTHSTNAVSVATYALWMLHETKDMEPTAKLIWQVVCYVYAVSIMFGRLYCGMHGTFDVVIGALLGGFITLLQVVYGPSFDAWICGPSVSSPVIVLLVLLVVIRTHPEPADDCPCFDDSVAFAGVLVGAEAAIWHYSKTPYSVDGDITGAHPYSLEKIGLTRTVVRIVLGVLIVFVWRAAMKPLLLKILPPIFRTVESVGADLPRRFFLKASQYTSVPPLRKDDNVIPSASEIPGLINNVRQRRGRAVSIGPQSVADAYETIAYRREQRRRESMSRERRSMSPSVAGLGSVIASMSAEGTANGSSDPTQRDHESLSSPMANTSRHATHTPSREDRSVMSPPFPPKDQAGLDAAMLSNKQFAEHDTFQEEKERREIFMNIERVRVRYDVEVVTKLIVYAGIAWLAIEGAPILFELIGLGMGVRQSR